MVTMSTGGKTLVIIQVGIASLQKGEGLVGLVASREEVINIIVNNINAT